MLLLAGCGGGSTPPHRTDADRLPHALAQRWEAEAQAVADAAAAGEGCRAHELAGSLRNDVIGSETKVPGRLWKPLLFAVNSLANRVHCPPQTLTVTVPVTTGPPKPGHGHGPPGHDHGHGPHGGGGDHGGDGGDG